MSECSRPDGLAIQAEKCGKKREAWVDNGQWIQRNGLLNTQMEQRSSFLKEVLASIEPIVSSHPYVSSLEGCFLCTAISLFCFPLICFDLFCFALVFVAFCISLFSLHCFPLHCIAFHFFVFLCFVRLRVSLWISVFCFACAFAFHCFAIYLCESQPLVGEVAGQKRPLAEQKEESY